MDHNFDDLTRLAALACQTSMAALCLVNTERASSKSTYGVSPDSMPSEDSFAGQAVLQDKLFEVCDARSDARFSQHPLVIAPPHIRFYAGMPLTDAAGSGLGVLAVMDCEPRKIDPRQREMLQALARQAEIQLSARSSPPTHDVESLTAEEFAYQHAPCGFQTLTPDGKVMNINDTCLRWTGYEREELIGQTFEKMLAANSSADFQTYLARLRQGKSLRDVRMDLQRRDDTIFPVMVDAYAMRADNNVSAISVMISDLTDRCKLEQELKATQDELEAKVAERLKEVRHLSQRRFDAQEDERREIARELHDEVGQLLTGLKLQVEAYARLTNVEQVEQLQLIQSYIGELMLDVREISLRLRPPMLDDQGLFSALKYKINKFMKRANLKISFVTFGIEHRRFPTAVETAAYRIVQEALTNVARHAKCSEANVRVWADETMLNLQIEDQGQGFTYTQNYQTAGLSGMQERATMLGGNIQIISTPGAGTTILAAIPINAVD